MGGVKSIFTGPPKPKKDKTAERLAKEQLALEKQRAKSADEALESSRRARLSGGTSLRSGLAYVPPSTQSGTLG